MGLDSVLTRLLCADRLTAPAAIDKVAFVFILYYPGGVDHHPVRTKMVIREEMEPAGLVVHGNPPVAGIDESLCLILGQK